MQLANGESIFYDPVPGYDAMTPSISSNPWDFAPRDKLPFFKDPKVKISIWTVLKDSIGKDLSKITMPVYFNQPLSLL